MNPIKNYFGWKKLYEASENIYKKIERYYSQGNWSGLADIIDDADNAVDDDESHVQHVLLMLKSLDDFEALDDAMRSKYEMGVWERIDDFFEDDDFEKFSYNDVKAKVNRWKEDSENKEKNEKLAHKGYTNLKSSMFRDGTVDTDNKTYFKYTFKIPDNDDGTLRYETDGADAEYRFEFEPPTEDYRRGVFKIFRLGETQQSGWTNPLTGIWNSEDNIVKITLGNYKYHKEIPNINSMDDIVKKAFYRENPEGFVDVDGNPIELTRRTDPYTGIVI